MEPVAVPVPTRQERPAEGEAQELLGLERLLFWLRLAGIGVVLLSAPMYRLASPWPLAAGVALVGVAVVAQRVTLRPTLTVPDLRRRALVLLALDMAAVYLIGTAFVADAEWLGFYFYPMLSLEATLVAGTRAGLGVTALSVVVYLLQLATHLGYAHRVEVREVIGAVALLALTGAGVSALGVLADRGRRDLRVMLDLGATLAHQRDEAEVLELLDRRLYEAVGGRVRSVAVRDASGDFQVIRWRTRERRQLTRDQISSGLGSFDQVSGALSEGAALTYPTDAWSAVTSALGLPEWARAVTLVPIFLEGRWIGVLPVLWAADRAPTRHELRLLYGMAGHVGLALAQDQLARVREEAALDPLTRLLNRRAIADELSGFVARAARRDGRLAILFCDLDGFKGVNDRRGHEAGDTVLQAVAAAIRGALRQGDVVGRYGGDELLVIAADADADDASALGQRVQAAVRAAAGADGVDITIGVAVFPEDGLSEGDLMVAADQAMYRGKLRGPGQVMVAGEIEPRVAQPVAAAPNLQDPAPGA